jgi:hypothetical protein
MEMVSHGTKLPQKSEICHISFTFPINVANENFNLAEALGCDCRRGVPTHASGEESEFENAVYLLLEQPFMQVCSTW